jgi:osmotically-inducible protein OsmY
MKKSMITLLWLVPMLAISAPYASNYRMMIAENNKKEVRVSDSELKTKIDKQLKDSWFGKGYEHITVEVNEGVVILTGAVDSQSDANEVEARVRDIKGVKLVKNRLAAGNRDYASSRDLSDDNVKKAVERELADSWWNTYSNVTVEVDSGAVILKGTVDSEDDIKDIEERLEGIPGVKVIRSQLKIVR